MTGGVTPSPFKIPVQNAFVRDFGILRRIPREPDYLQSRRSNLVEAYPSWILGPLTCRSAGRIVILTLDEAEKGTYICTLYTLYIHVTRDVCMYAEIHTHITCIRRENTAHSATNVAVLILPTVMSCSTHSGDTLLLIIRASPVRHAEARHLHSCRDHKCILYTG